jgi:hypothetical protein
MNRVGWIAAGHDAYCESSTRQVTGRPGPSTTARGGMIRRAHLPLIHRH